MTLTLVHPALARLSVRHLLAAGPRGSTQYHGLTLRYDNGRVERMPFFYTDSKSELVWFDGEVFMNQDLSKR